MKQTINGIFFGVCILIVASVFTACKSDEDNAEPKETFIVGGEGSNIKITAVEENFQNTSATRSAFAEPKDYSVDLGNGLTANVSLEEDEDETDTRATKLLDGGGTYTIYAVDMQGPYPKRLTGLRKEIKGTFSNGNFTRTSGKLTVPPGKYKFVCINENIQTVNDAYLTFPHGKDAICGVTDEITLTAADKGLDVHFTVKHIGSRLRFKFKTYKQNTPGIKGQLISNLMQVSGYYWNPGRFGHSSVSTPMVPIGFNLPATGEANTASAGYAPYTATTDFYYALPGLTDEDNHGAPRMFFEFTEGSIYGHSLVGKRIPFMNLTGHMQSGKSYTVVLSLTPNPIYLFSDKTVGMLEDKGSRTPIALVYRGKTKTQQGIAMGLRGMVKEWEITTSPTYNGNNYTTTFATTDDALQDENGYNWTWTSSTDVDGLVKANQQTRYPAFYWASHDPYGVGFGEWYFPAIGEIINVFDKIAKKTNVSSGHVTFQKQLSVITNAFVNAGGSDPFQYRSWSSTLYANGTFSSPIVFYPEGSGNTIAVRPQGARKSHLGYIQTFPFVRY